MIGSAIGKLFRTIIIGLDGLIYPLIPTVYNVFYDLASGKLFSNDTISTITGNIYILVSVAMLFAFGAQLIKTIINPDLLLDTKNGTMGFIKRMVIAVVLIAAIPLLFSNLQIVQKAILDNSLIEKIILGIDANDKEDNGKSVTEKAGQYLAGATIGSSVYPKKDATSKKENLGDIYNEMINENINKIDDIGDSINERYDSNGTSKYVFTFQALPSLVAGFVVLYMLLLACFDMALRLVKLAFLEISAPVSIIAYIIQGKTAFDRWFKELLSTFAGVFIKVATISFVVVGLTQLDNIVTGSKSSGWLIRLFVICGLLMFIKLLPQLIQSLFGINIDSKGGIRGRLASMAAVGGVAAGAWDKFKRNPIRYPVQTIGKPIGAIGGAATNTAERIKKGFKEGEGVKGKIAGVAGGLGTGILTTGFAAKRGWNNGWKSYGREQAYYRETHPRNSTFRGRVREGARNIIGLDSSVEAMDRDLAHLNYTYHDENGEEHTLTQSEFAERRRNLQNQAADEQMRVNENNRRINENNTTITRNNRANSYVDEARERAKNLALQSNSRIEKTKTVDVGNGKTVTLNGNLNNWKNQIEALKQNVPVRLEGQSDEEYNQAVANHASMISKLEQAYDQQVKTATNETISQSLAGINSDSIINTAIANANTALEATSLSEHQITADNIVHHYTKDVTLGNGQVVKLEGSMSDWRDIIDEMKNTQKPSASSFSSQAAYNAALNEFNDKIARLEQAYTAQNQIAQNDAQHNLNSISNKLKGENNTLSNNNAELENNNQTINVNLEDYNSQLSRLQMAEDARNRQIEEEKASDKYKRAQANRESDEYRRNNNNNRN